MANSQDARPFVHLKKDAEAFRVKFDEDIKECMNLLDAKITSLICDPDSLHGPLRNVKQNNLLEFSKAKYDIFISVKSLINKKEREWLDYISELKKLFIENVEIFLAGTKLEVKLPSSEFQSSLVNYTGPKKSPGNQKSISSITSSVYPIIHNIAESFPGVSADVYQKENTSSSESSENESRPVPDSLHLKKLPDRSSRSKIAVIHESSKCSEEWELSKLENSFNQVKGRRGKGKSKIGVKNATGVSADVNQKESTSRSESSENESRPVPDSLHLKKLPSRSSRSKIAAIPESNKCSEELELSKLENSFNQIKGRRARGKSKIGVKNATENEARENAESENDEEEPKRNINTRKSAKGRKSAKVISNTSESDLQSPVARPANLGARRKTLLPNLEDISGADTISGTPSRAKSKRKTIGGVSELQSAAPSKRLKVSNQKNTSVKGDVAAANDNLLESDDDYSEWMALKNVDGKVPTLPAIYEVKVWRAKKPAYIGVCESLRQKLTLYKLRQNSGHKHLDKFLERNFNDIQIRFEVVSSIDYAKGEVKNRINDFVAQYKTTPAYN